MYLICLNFDSNLSLFLILLNSRFQNILKHFINCWNLEICCWKPPISVKLKHMNTNHRAWESWALGRNLGSSLGWHQQAFQQSLEPFHSWPYKDLNCFKQKLVRNLIYETDQSTFALVEEGTGPGASKATIENLQGSLRNILEISVPGGSFSSSDVTSLSQ